MFPFNYIDKIHDNISNHYCDNDVFNAHRFVSYSQEGEDIILRHMLSGISAGFFVDIGAHHPIRFSNTKYFYDTGWSGINIDPIPGIMEIFKKVRSRDVNLEMGVSDSHEFLEYYSFNEPALNTFNKQYAETTLKHPSIQLLEKVPVEVWPLATILERHSEGRAIDLMNIDTEEFELKVLASNDWERFRPRILVIECLSAELENFRECPIYQFLSARDYSLFAKTVKSYIFKNRRA